MAEEDLMKECGTNCGCTAEIGTVIHENDTIYEFTLEGSKDEVLAKFADYLSKAKDADENVKVEFMDTENQVFTRKGSFEFSCTVEKMVFQFKAHAI
jgi:uncharacterized protein YfcZ (UPF0381/DUF406 family)